MRPCAAEERCRRHLTTLKLVGHGAAGLVGSYGSCAEACERLRFLPWPAAPDGRPMPSSIHEEHQADARSDTPFLEAPRIGATSRKAGLDFTSV